MRGAGETMLGTRIVIAAFRKILVVRSSRRIRVTTLDQRAAGVSGQQVAGGVEARSLAPQRTQEIQGYSPVPPGV